MMPAGGATFSTLLVAQGGGFSVSLGWLLILLVVPGLLVLLAVVTALLLRRRGRDAAGPGYYHVLGFDKNTQARRELTLRADSPTAARGRAEMDGIVATDVRRVEDSA